MTAPTPPPLSKSLEKGGVRRSTSTSSNSQQGRDSSPSKSLSSRRSSVTKTRTSAGRRSSHASATGQNVRAVVRSKMAERKDGLRASNHNNKPNAIQSNKQQGGGNPSATSSSNQSVASSSKRSPGGKRGSRPGSVSTFLKSAHRQLKADIAKIQDQIIFLYVLNSSIINVTEVFLSFW